MPYLHESYNKFLLNTANVQIAIILHDSSCVRTYSRVTFAANRGNSSLFAREQHVVTNVMTILKCSWQIFSVLSDRDELTRFTANTIRLSVRHNANHEDWPRFKHLRWLIAIRSDIREGNTCEWMQIAMNMGPNHDEWARFDYFRWIVMIRNIESWMSDWGFNGYLIRLTRPGRLRQRKEGMDSAFLWICWFWFYTSINRP